MKTHSVLSIDNLSAGAAGVPVVAGFSLDAGPGGIAGLLGPSGCGKTTLLRTVAGLIDPVEGSVSLLGRSPEETGWPEYRAQAVYVDQMPVMLNESVEFNLRRPFAYRVRESQYSAERARELFDRLRLDPALLKQDARKLSGGQMQRVGLIRALLTGPTVLLLDEPTSALDEDTRGAVENLILEFARSGPKAVILATHNREQAGRICTQAVDLRPYLTEEALAACKLENTEGTANGTGA